MATSATQSDSGPRSSLFLLLSEGEGAAEEEGEPFPTALPSAPSPSSTARTVNAIRFPSLAHVTKLIPLPSGRPVTATSTADGIPSFLASAAGTTTPSPSWTTDRPV